VRICGVICSAAQTTAYGVWRGMELGSSGVIADKRDQHIAEFGRSFELAQQVALVPRRILEIWRIVGESRVRRVAGAGAGHITVDRLS
jgi:hypothetical protein